MTGHKWVWNKEAGGGPCWTCSKCGVNCHRLPSDKPRPEERAITMYYKLTCEEYQILQIHDS